MTLFEVHQAWAWVVVVSNGVLGVWSTAAHRFARLRSRALWWCILLAELAIVVQVVLGAAVMGVEHRRAPGFHLFYGFVALASIGIIYSYREQMRRQKYLLYGLGSLFLMGLCIRAMILTTPGAR